MKKTPTIIKVQLEDQIFDSVSDAAKFLDLKTPSSLYAAIKRNQKAYKGFRLTAIKANKTTTTPKAAHRYVPVYCENLNKTFKSIEEAARYAKVSGWTMGVKMTTAGKFVDLNGNVYTRLLPMQSIRSYANTGDSLRKVYKNPMYLNGKSRDIKPDNIIEKSITPPVQTENKLELAKTVLKEKVIESINKNDFTFAKNLLDVINELN